MSDCSTRWGWLRPKSLLEKDNDNNSLAVEIKMFDNQTIIRYHICEEDFMTNTKQVVNVGIMVGLLILASQISFKLGPIPITAQTLMIMVIATLMRVKESVVVGLVYLLMGAIGLPVFASLNGGLAYLLGPTGGFLISFPIMLGLISYTLSFNGSWYFKVLSYILATAVCYLIGVEYFMLSTGYSLAESLNLCVYPFILGDLLKIGCAVVCTDRLTQINFIFRKN